MVEQVSDPAWRLQVIEELRAEYGGLGQLADLPPEVRNELRELGLEQLFADAEPAARPVQRTVAPALKGGIA